MGEDWLAGLCPTNRDEKNSDGVPARPSWSGLAPGSGENLIKNFRGWLGHHIAVTHTRHPAANHATFSLFLVAAPN